MVASTAQKIKIAHSPDSDDAFMFYAIAEKKIDLAGFDFEISSAEIQKLNDQALEAKSSNSKPEFDIFAVSFHAYAYLSDRYQILRSGSSMGGQNYGPRIVTNNKSLNLKNIEGKKDLGGLKVAIPGKLTSAYLCLQLYQAGLNSTNDFEPYFCSFDEVFDLLGQGKVDASLLIHESQLKYKDLNLDLLVDLGAWWHQETGFSMPLGCNVIDRSLGQETVSKVAKVLKESIEYGLKNFDDTLAYARRFSNNGLDDKRAVEYIGMYVNEQTRSLSDDDIKSIKLMLDSGKERNLISNNQEIIVDPV